MTTAHVDHPDRAAVSRPTRMRVATLLRAALVVGIVLGAHAGHADVSALNGPRWSGWHARGGITDVSISGASTGRRLLLFAKGQADRRIYFAESTPARSAVTWQQMPGYGTTYQPIVGAVTETSVTYAFHRGDDTRVYFARRPYGGTFSSWAEVPGGMRTNVALAAVSENARLFVFAQSLDRQIWFTTLEEYSEVWEGWRLIGGTTDVALGAASTDGWVFLFGKGINDRRVYMNVFDTEKTHAWNGWREVPGGFTTATTVAAAENNSQIVAVARGDDRLLWTNTYNPFNLTWTGWSPMAGAVTNVAPAATSVDGNLVVLHRGDDLQIYENYLQPKLSLDRQITVPANAQWVDTGLDVWDGANLAVTAWGQWSNAGTPIGPNGAGYLHGYALAPSLPFGSLIARVGNTTFGFGTGFMGVVPPGAPDGRLYVSVNDIPWGFGDNGGALSVSIACTAPVRLTINARDGWVNTGLIFGPGVWWHAGSYGTWSNSGTPTLGPGGFVGYRYPGTLIPNADLASLVGWVENGFQMGASYNGVGASAPRYLYLSMNDVPGTFADNQGSLSVSILPGSHSY